MPAIVGKVTIAQNTCSVPMIKKIKKEHNDSHSRQRWCIKNRENYSPTTLRQPYGVNITENIIVTTEGLWPHSRVQIFNHDGKCCQVIGQGQILPFGVTLNHEHQVVLTDHHERTVKAFTQDGHPAWSWPKKKFIWPNGIAMNSKGEYVIADWSRGCVCVYDGEGDIALQFSTADPANPGTSCPDYLCVDQHDRIIISDAYDRSVKIFSNDGQLLSKIGETGGAECLVHPRGVTTDDKNNIIVADWADSSVKLYTPGGIWCRNLVSKQQVEYPLAVDVCGRNLVVTEHKLNRSPAMKMFDID